MTGSTISGNSATGANGVAGVDYGNGPGAGADAFGGGASERANSTTADGAQQVQRSTFAHNTAIGGAGATSASGQSLAAGGNAYGGALHDLRVNATLITLTDNAAVGGAGTTRGIGHGGGFAGSGSLGNSTIAGNRATVGGGVFSDGGFFARDTIQTFSALIADNIGGDWAGLNVESSGHTLVGDGSGGFSDPTDLLGTVAHPLNPLLAPLGDYGGTTQTLALLPGSPAIDTGTEGPGGAPVATDQRGNARVMGSSADIGAFESGGFSLAIAAGDNQKALIKSTFAKPLLVSVTPVVAGEPVAGGLVTFAAPRSGASAGVSPSTATIDFAGTARSLATANATAGAYALTASAAGASAGVGFTLTNTLLLVARNDTATTTPDAPVKVNVLANDTGDGVKLLDIISGPAHGVATIVNGQIVYTPNFAFHATDTLRYRIRDDSGKVDGATLTITVGSGVGVTTEPVTGTPNVLDIVGTAGGDTIQIRPAGQGKVTVLFGGKSRGVFGTPNFIAAFGLGGNDTITVDSSIKAPLLLDGGDGNDTLRAGGGNGVLLAGGGDDQLFGGAGRTILIGGLGGDSLHAGPGGSVLIGDVTKYDGDLPALNQLALQWGRTDGVNGSYANRVNGLVKGQGFAARIPLNAGSVSSTPTPTDRLFGGAGLDLFYVNPTRVSGKGDDVFNRTSAEALLAVKSRFA